MIKSRYDTSSKVTIRCLAFSVRTHFIHGKSHLAFLGRKWDMYILIYFLGKSDGCKLFMVLVEFPGSFYKALGNTYWKSNEQLHVTSSWNRLKLTGSKGEVLTNIPGIYFKDITGLAMFFYFMAVLFKPNKLEIWIVAMKEWEVSSALKLLTKNDAKWWVTEKWCMSSRCKQGRIWWATMSDN